MKHGVLKHFHPMVGIDFHIPWPPGSPSPAPSPVPYKTFMTMLGTSITAKYSMDSYTDYFGWTMLQGTDIGPLIPHFGPPSLLMPIEFVLSSSKSHFVVASHQVNNIPIAVSLLWHVNPNLNCGTPVPTPTGVVLAMTTHRVDMTWADVFGGFGAMFSDWVIQSILQKLGSALGGRLASFLQRRLFSRFLAGPLERALAEGGDEVLTRLWAGAVAAGRAERFASWGGTAAEGLLGLLVGGPMGVDIGTIPGVSTPGGRVGDEASGFGESMGRAVGDYLDADDPQVGDFPLPQGDTATA